MAEQYEIPLFPLNTVLFPGMILPLRIFEERYKLMLKQCIADSKPFGVVLLKTGQAEGAFSGEIYSIGTTAQITQVNTLADDTYNILTLGVKRFRLIETYQTHPYLSAIVEDYPLTNGTAPEAVSGSLRLLHLIERYLEAFRKIGKLPFRIDQVPKDPITLAFLTAIMLPVSNDDKQSLLSVVDIPELLREEFRLMRYETHMTRILADEPQAPTHPTSSFSLN
ncbi:MAG: LON peptidase substrate-binding domain-containing protein [Chloroflexi bacterium]|nr:LON peptidase substrate-binding domain-containing protein [Chloroflexota bacterium]